MNKRQRQENILNQFRNAKIPKIMIENKDDADLDQDHGDTLRRWILIIILEIKKFVQIFER